MEEFLNNIPNKHTITVPTKSAQNNRMISLLPSKKMNVKRPPMIANRYTNVITIKLRVLDLRILSMI